MAYVPLADQEQELHHPHSWITQWVFSQDHKVIAIQYGGVAIAVGVVATYVFHFVLCGVLGDRVGAGQLFIDLA